MTAAQRIRGNLRAASSASASATAPSPRNVIADQTPWLLLAHALKKLKTGTLPRVAARTPVAATSSAGSTHTSPLDSDQRNAPPGIERVIGRQLVQPSRSRDHEIPRPRRPERDGLPVGDAEARRVDPPHQPFVAAGA